MQSKTPRDETHLDSVGHTDPGELCQAHAGLRLISTLSKGVSWMP